MISTKGTLVVALAAGLFASAAPVIASAAEGGKVHCEGVNACKGKGGCHSASNACSGKNGCKGKGWVEMSEKDCKDKGGKVAPAK
ncbi:MAG TPA: hypothetical protein VGL59_23580 [Polyangia bacterium]|jgi:hypothetical protein